MDVSHLVRQFRGLTGPVWIARLRYIYFYGILVVFGLLLFVGFGGFRGLPRVTTVDADLGPTNQHGDLSRPDAPFVSWPLARLCRETTWVPGVIFMCNNNSGGIGNIRNFILTCIRYAIEVGATGLVLPQIETRSETDLAHLFGGHQPLDYFFDTRHFRDGLGEACSALVLYDRVEDIPHLTDKRPEKLVPKSFGVRGGCDYRDLNRHTDAFRLRFHEWVAQSALDFHLPAVSALHPRLFQPVWGVQWEWPVAKDGLEFTNSFGGLLKFRQDILELGAETVAAMRHSAALRSNSRTARQFAGVHLRTESDSLSFWPTFESQSTQFLKALAEKRLGSVYLATGNDTEAMKFRDRAKAAGGAMHIVTKADLLKTQPKLLQRLQSLTWDQRALIDFVVLLSCDFFLGVSPSSFSMNIAARRHLSSQGIYTRPWRVGDQGDERSRLVGNYTNYWDDWLFMYDALWP